MTSQANNPQRIHVKKLDEIYVSYLKNQSKGSEAAVWAENLTSQVIDSVARYAQQSVKELIRIIQIDTKQFITKLCSLLIKDIRKTAPLEKRFLSLALLRELMSANLDDRRTTVKIAEKPIVPEVELKSASKSPTPSNTNRQSTFRQSLSFRGQKRAVGNVYMKGIDVLKLRGTHNKINHRLLRWQSAVNKRMHRLSQKESLPLQHFEKNLFCMHNEREIFQCLSSLIKTEPTFNCATAKMLNTLLDCTNRSQIAAAQDEYFELIQYMLETSVDPKMEKQPSFFYQAMRAFKTIVKILKESSLNQQWPFIFRFTFDFISSQKVKDYIENQLGGQEIEDEVFKSESDLEEDEDRVWSEMAIQVGFDLFSYLSQRVSLDQDSAIGTQQDFVTSVLNLITCKSDWHNAQWVKFVFMLIVCNGGSMHTIGLLDFKESVQTRFMKLVMDQLANKPDGTARSFLDFEMLNLIISSIINEVIYLVNNNDLSPSHIPNTIYQDTILSPMPLKRSDSVELDQEGLIQNSLQKIATRLSSLVDLLHLSSHSPRQLEMSKLNRCLKLVTSLAALKNQPFPITNTITAFLEAYLHSLKNGQEVEKFLDLWIVTNKDEIVAKNPDATPLNLSSIKMFLKVSSRISRILSYKLDLMDDQAFKQIPLEHQTMFIKLAVKCLEQPLNSEETQHCVVKSINMDLRIKLTNEASTLPSLAQSQSLMHYLSTLAQLIMFHTRLALQPQLDIFQAWFVLNHSLHGQQGKQQRHLASLLAFLCQLATKTDSRLVPFLFAITARCFSLCKLQDGLQHATSTHDTLPSREDTLTQLSDKLKNNFKTPYALLKHEAELAQFCKMELLRLEVDVAFFNDAQDFFLNPVQERFSYSSITPVKLKEIDFKIDVDKLQSPSLVQQDPEDDLLGSNASIVY